MILNTKPIIFNVKSSSFNTKLIILYLRQPVQAVLQRKHGVCWGVLPTVCKEED